MSTSSTSRFLVDGIPREDLHLNSRERSGVTSQKDQEEQDIEYNEEEEEHDKDEKEEDQSALRSIRDAIVAAERCFASQDFDEALCKLEQAKYYALQAGVQVPHMRPEAEIYILKSNADTSARMALEEDDASMANELKKKAVNDARAARRKSRALLPSLLWPASKAAKSPLQKTASQESLLLKLPVETRQNIWEQHFKGHDMAYNEQQLHDKHDGPPFIIRFWILATCRQIYNEAIDIAYREITYWTSPSQPISALIPIHRTHRGPLQVATWSNPYELQRFNLNQLEYCAPNLQILTICSNFICGTTPMKYTSKRALWIVDVIQQLPILKKLYIYVGHNFLPSNSTVNFDFAKELRDTFSSNAFQKSVQAQHVHFEPYEAISHSTILTLGEHVRRRVQLTISTTFE